MFAISICCYSGVFYIYTLRVLSSKEPLVETDVYKLRTTAFRTFEPFCLYRANGHHLYIVY